MTGVEETAGHVPRSHPGARSTSAPTNARPSVTASSAGRMAAEAPVEAAERTSSALRPGSVSALPTATERRAEMTAVGAPVAHALMGSSAFGVNARASRIALASNVATTDVAEPVVSAGQTKHARTRHASACPIARARNAATMAVGALAVPAVGRTPRARTTSAFVSSPTAPVRAAEMMDAEDRAGHALKAISVRRATAPASPIATGRSVEQTDAEDRVASALTERPVMR